MIYELIFIFLILKHSQKNIYFTDVQKNNSCTDNGYINKYLWIYTSCAQLTEDALRY
jgi:hypothetical protein